MSRLHRCRLHSPGRSWKSLRRTEVETKVEAGVNESSGSAAASSSALISVANSSGIEIGGILGWSFNPESLHVIGQVSGEVGPSMARASSIRRRKLSERLQCARGQQSLLRSARAIASQVLMPVVRAMRSSVSMVVLPMPRGGEFTDRAPVQSSRAGSAPASCS